MDEGADEAHVISKSGSADQLNSEGSGVYMACLFQANKLGLAFYDSQSCELSVMQSHDDGSAGPMGHQMLQLAKLQANPEVIYTSSKTDTNFIARLMQAANASDESEQPHYDVRLKKATLFHPRAALACLQHLHVQGMPLGLSGSDRLHMLGSMIKLACTQQLCALGALLSILHNEGLLNTGDEEAGLVVNNLSEVVLDGFLLVDGPSLSALQIFQQERHPSAMGIGQSKEGFTVVGMLNKCVTSMGRRLLQLWFRRPIINLQVIQERQDAVAMFMHAPDSIKGLQSILAKIKDVPKVLQRLRTTQTAAAKDFALLTESLANLTLLKHSMLSSDFVQRVSGQSFMPSGGTRRDASGHAVHVPLPSRHRSASGGTAETQGTSQLPGIVRKAFVCINDALQTCHALITSVIDTDQEDGMIIASGVSDQLDELKMTYASLPSMLTHVVQQELDRIPRSLRRGLLEGQQMWSIVYMPQVGFMTRLEGQRLTADLQDYLSDYEFAFEGTGEEVGGMYYYSDTTRELNAEMGDMLHKIHDFEGTLCTELLRRVAAHGPAVAQAVSVAAEIDCLISLALSASEYNFTRPTLTTSNELQIKGGRHMLTELVVDTFIPNDTIMTPTSDRVQVVLIHAQIRCQSTYRKHSREVITGPNFSGKSCYAKQVGIIVLLAHVGSFVPAESAVVGITDRIFTRIVSADTQSIPQSTFMADLSQVSTMLRSATAQSLCLIDEFGKGTLSNDGVGLLCATLQSFVCRQGSPKVIACTHYSEVLNERYLPRHPLLAFHTMNVLVESEDTAAQQSQSDIVFLYRLVPGYAAPSFGVHCAQLAGLSSNVLQRARQVIQLQGANMPIPAWQTHQQQHREAGYHKLVDQLRQLNTHDDVAVSAFLRKVHSDIHQCCRTA